MTGRQAFNLLVGQIQATLGASPLSVPAGKIGVGWPPETQLHDVARNQSLLVSVYDGGVSRNVTRWPVEHDVPVITNPGTTATLSAPWLVPGHNVTLTLGGSILVNDAIALTAQFGAPLVGGAEVAIASSSDTLATLAAKLVTQINADTTLNQWMSASSTGNTITFTCRASFPVLLGVATGNLATTNYEFRRVARSGLVVLWVSRDVDRETYGNPIMTLLAQLTCNFGIQNTDGNWLRVQYTGDVYRDDPVMSDIYRRDFKVTLEYGETVQETLYPVLVGIAQQGTF